MRPLEELYCLTKPKKSRFDGVTSHIPWWHCKHGLIYWQNQLPYTVLFWNVWSNCVYSVWFIATLNTVFISQVRLKPSRSSVNTSTFSKVPLSVRVMEPLTPKKNLFPPSQWWNTSDRLSTKTSIVSKHSDFVEVFAAFFSYQLCCSMTKKPHKPSQVINPKVQKLPRDQSHDCPKRYMLHSWSKQQMLQNLCTENIIQISWDVQYTLYTLCKMYDMQVHLSFHDCTCKHTDSACMLHSCFALFSCNVHLW